MQNPPAKGRQTGFCVRKIFVMFAGERACGRDSQPLGRFALGAQPRPQRGLIFPPRQPRRGHRSKHLWPRTIHPAEGPTKPSGPAHCAPLPIPAYTPRSAGQKPGSGKRQPHIFRRRCRPPGTRAAWETKNHSATRQTRPPTRGQAHTRTVSSSPQPPSRSGKCYKASLERQITKGFHKRPSLRRCCKAITIADPSLTTPSTGVPRAR